MDQGVAIVLAACAAATPALITALGVRRANRKLDAQASAIADVHEEVKTFNEGTVGTNSANAETLRIEAKPHDERTVTEQHHLDTAPPAEPPQGPAR